MNDQLSVSGRINSFDQRNGGKNASCVLGEHIYYSNGAWREAEALGRLVEPPENEFERLTNITLYHQARLKQAVRMFDILKEDLAFSVHPDAEALSRLKDLQTLVSKRNAALATATEALAATDEGKRRQRNRELDAETKQKTAQWRDDVKQVRI